MLCNNVSLHRQSRSLTQFATQLLKGITHFVEQKTFLLHKTHHLPQLLITALFLNKFEQEQVSSFLGRVYLDGPA